MNNYKILVLTTIAVGVSLVGPPYLIRATAPNATTSAASTSPSSNMNLGNPIYTENDQSTATKPVVINGTPGLQASYSGTGVVKGVSFSTIGSFLSIPRSDGTSDVNGHGIITTSNGEKATYTFYEIRQIGADGTRNYKGAAFFHTTSSGRLALVNNLVVVFKYSAPTILGWELK